MMFNVYYILFMYLLFFNLIGGDFTVMYLIWYIFGFSLLGKLYSHVSFMLLALEVVSLISMSLVLYMVMKNFVSYSMFFLFLCLVVGEAMMGLSLLVMSSRVEAKELSSMVII